MTTLDDPPDGERWPDRFAVDIAWADDRGTAWRAVTNHPCMQARRRDDLLDLRVTSGDTSPHTYRMSVAALGDHTVYLAQKEG